MVKLTTVLFEVRPAKRNLPSEEAASDMSANPTELLAGNGEPDTAVRPPRLGSTRKAAMSEVAPSEAYRYFPPLTTIRLTANAPPPVPPPPVANGEFAIEVKP